jgi:hypothetical protein
VALLPTSDRCRTWKTIVLWKARPKRAGVTGHNVRYVLLIGTLAVIVLFAIAYVVTKA